MVNHLCLASRASLALFAGHFKELVCYINSTRNQVVTLTIRVFNNFLEKDLLLSKSKILRIKKRINHFLDSKNWKLGEISSELLQ